MSRLLAWSFGASVGLVVGFLVGESFRDGLALARLGRPEPREGAGTGPSATGPVNGAQIGAQPIPAQREGTLDVGDLHDRPDYQEALARAKCMPWEPGVDLTEWLDEHAACTQRSPGGGLVCCQKGAHRMHRFEGTSAPDRKDDTDEGID